MPHQSTTHNSEHFHLEHFILYFSVIFRYMYLINNKQILNFDLSTLLKISFTNFVVIKISVLPDVESQAGKRANEKSAFFVIF